MGGQSHTHQQSNRPESGGADRDGAKEKSGLLDREKEEYAVAEKAKHEESARQQRVEQEKQKDQTDQTDQTELQEDGTNGGSSYPPGDA